MNATYALQIAKLLRENPSLSVRFKPGDGGKLFCHIDKATNAGVLNWTIDVIDAGPMFDPALRKVLALAAAGSSSPAASDAAGQATRVPAG